MSLVGTRPPTLDSNMLKDKCNLISVIIPVYKYCLMFEKKAVLIDTPTHGNLGDHAIVLTQKQLLVKNKVSTHELSA